MCLYVSVLFTQTEINAMENVRIFTDANQEVLWLYVSVDVIFSMKQLHFLDLH